ncbi:hypothetical protein N0V82_008462 [Gnomoniopsis sp. IMI 355080]|nr:hypothetical protein N0V82_008462 [Gnomoniopsis sp. IMI 355080]
MTPPPLQQMNEGSKRATKLPKKDGDLSQPPKLVKPSKLSPSKNIQATPQRKTLAERAAEFPATPSRSWQTPLQYNSPTLVSLDGKFKAGGSRANDATSAKLKSPTKLAPKFKTLAERAGEFPTTPASQTMKPSYLPYSARAERPQDEQEAPATGTSSPSKIAGSPMPRRKTLVERAGEYPDASTLLEMKKPVKGQSLISLQAKLMAEQQNADAESDEL